MRAACKNIDHDCWKLNKQNAVASHLVTCTQVSLRLTLKVDLLYHDVLETSIWQPVFNSHSPMRFKFNSKRLLQKNKTVIVKLKQVRCNQTECFWYQTGIKLVQFINVNKDNNPWTETWILIENNQIWLLECDILRLALYLQEWREKRLRTNQRTA